MSTETYLPSAARTTTTNGADISVPIGAKSVQFEIEATALAATPSVVPTIQGKLLSGAYATLLAGAAIVAAGSVYLHVGPGLPVVANLSANAVLPDTIRLIMTAGDADSLTYSVRYKFSG